MRRSFIEHQPGGSDELAAMQRHVDRIPGGWHIGDRWLGDQHVVVVMAGSFHGFDLDGLGRAGPFVRAARAAFGAVTYGEYVGMSVPATVGDAVEQLTNPDEVVTHRFPTVDWWDPALLAAVMRLLAWPPDILEDAVYKAADRLAETMTDFGGNITVVSQIVELYASLCSQNPECVGSSHVLACDDMWDAALLAYATHRVVGLPSS